MGLTPPEDMPPEAQVVWNEVADRVDAVGSSPVARELLRSWCMTVTEIRSCERWVAEHGTTYTTRDDKGNVRAVGDAPRYRQLRALRGDLARLAKDLGFSPPNATTRRRTGTAQRMRYTPAPPHPAPKEQ